MKAKVGDYIRLTEEISNHTIGTLCRITSVNSFPEYYDVDICNTDEMICNLMPEHFEVFIESKG